MANDEVCMGLSGKCYGDPDKLPEPHFPWLSLYYESSDIGEEDASGTIVFYCVVGLEGRCMMNNIDGNFHIPYIFH